MENINVEELREKIFADGKVTKEEVLDLWAKKDAQEETTAEFDSLFAEAVMAWLLADGQIDEEEAQFIVDKINEDEDIDDAEGELLQAIADHYSEGNTVPSCLIDAFSEYFEEDDYFDDEE